MTRADGLFDRRASAAIRAALADTRVVVINGARQAGKSTLARLVIEQRSDVEVRYLDDAGVRAAAAADPVAFVRGPAGSSSPVRPGSSRWATSLICSRAGPRP